MGGLGRGGLERGGLGRGKNVDVQCSISAGHSSGQPMAKGVAIVGYTCDMLHKNITAIIGANLSTAGCACMLCLSHSKSKNGASRVKSLSNKSQVDNFALMQVLPRGRKAKHEAADLEGGEWAALRVEAKAPYEAKHEGEWDSKI